MGTRGMGRRWVKNSSHTLPPLKLLHSSDLPRLSGTPAVPILWETSGLLPGDKGYLNPSVMLPSFPLPQQDSPSHFRAPGPCSWDQWHGEKGVSFLSSIFQYNQKLPQDEHGHLPRTPPHSCPSKNGMGPTERGVIRYCPLLHSASRLRAGRGNLLALQRPLAIWVT